jgi:hypothetical protein
MIDILIPFHGVVQASLTYFTSFLNIQQMGEKNKNMSYNQIMEMIPALPKDFRTAIDTGLVSCRKHPTDDLWISELHSYMPVFQTME